MKKKLICLFVFCICISFIASDCKKNLTYPQEPPPSGGDKYSMILASTTYGETWESIPASNFNNYTYESIKGIAHFSSDPGTFNIIAYDFQGTGTVFKTIDNGANWQNQLGLIEDITGDFNGKGFCVGVGGIENNVGFYLTTNSGSSWSPVQNFSAGEPRHFWRISFDEGMKQGMIIPYNPTDSTLSTVNGGDNWLKGAPLYNIGGYTGYINDIAVPGGGVAIACGNNGRIFMSTNLGGNWQQITSPVNDDLQSVSFYGYRGLIVGNNGTILRTTNSGLNWESIPVSTTKNLKKVHMMHPTAKSYICGDNVIISITFDIGNSLIIQRNEPNEYFEDLSVLGSLGRNVYVVGHKSVQ
jgi:photosystem II stability/assembly factor-like uncharacterized protein